MRTECYICNTFLEINKYVTFIINKLEFLNLERIFLSHFIQQCNIEGHNAKRIALPNTELIFILRCIQKFPDWPSGARTANGTALCH
jgi:hypothetical protein